jgi:hypothetical protein
MIAEEVTQYPLQWPIGHPRTRYQVRSKFSNKSFDKARKQMLHELSLLGADRVTISTNVRLRNDGYPYATDKPPEDKGIAVYFYLFKEPCVFACDKYTTMEDNLYAITKTVEALRGIDRWGVSEMLKRTFTGFKALPPAASSEPKRPWHKVLEVDSTSPVFVIEAAYKKLAKIRHPDMLGGSVTAFQELREAYNEAMGLHTL